VTETSYGRHGTAERPAMGEHDRRVIGCPRGLTRCVRWIAVPLNRRLDRALLGSSFGLLVARALARAGKTTGRSRSGWGHDPMNALVEEGSIGTGGAAPVAASGLRLRAQVTFWRGCWVPLAVGLGIRLLLAPFTSVSLDMGTWTTALQQVSSGLGIYSQPGFSYPPLWGYLISAGGGLVHLLGIAPQSIASSSPAVSALSWQDPNLGALVSSPLATLALKLPLVLSDVAVAWVVWHLALAIGADTRWARRAAMGWFLCPLVILGTAVAGEFDTLVALAVGAALLARVRGSYLLCGAAIAAGVMAKLTPAFLVPLLLASCLFPMSSESSSGRWGRFARLCAGGLGATALLLAPLMTDHQLSAAFSDVFTRTSTASSVGGLSWLGVSNLPPLSWISAWALSPGAPVARVAEYLDLIISLLAAILWTRMTSRSPARIVAIALGVLSAVVFVGPLANPQYLLWFLPLLFVLRFPRRRTVIAALAASGVLFEFAVQPPLTLLLPASRSLGIPPFSSIVSDAHWFTAGTLLGTPIGADLRSVAWLLMILAMLAGLGAARGLRRGRGLLPVVHPVDESVTAASAAVSRVGLGCAVLVLVLCPSLAGGFGVATAAAGGDPSISLAVGAGPSGPVASWVVKRSPLGGLTVSVLSVAHPVRVTRVVIYSDASYPDSGSSQFQVQGVVDHLPVDLRQDGLRVPVEVVDAARLRQMLSPRASRGTVVVVASGTLPDTVWSNGVDQVIPFLRAGGTLVFGGDVPGYYSVGPSPFMTAYAANAQLPRFGCGPQAPTPHPPLARDVTSMGEAGVKHLMGSSVLTPTSWGWTCVATKESPVARSLGLLSQSVHAGANVRRLQAVGGEALGFDVSGDTSIAWVPRGNGGVLLFGGQVNGPDLAADTARLLATCGSRIEPRVISGPTRATRGTAEVGTANRPARLIAVGTVSWTNTVFVFHRIEIAPRPRPEARP
jgi:hypothetical protein